MYDLAERCAALCEERGVRQLINIITNGLLLTRDVVDRLDPYGLNGIKITLDGDRDTHNRMRPLRGKQGTFDRIIENVRQVADIVPITIGGNFDESSVDSYPDLLDFLKQQEFSDKIAKINFKPIIKAPEPAAPKGMIPLTVVTGDGKPLAGTCMTSTVTSSFTDGRLQVMPARSPSMGPTSGGKYCPPQVSSMWRFWNVPAPARATSSGFDWRAYGRFNSSFSK